MTKVLFPISHFQINPAPNASAVAGPAFMVRGYTEAQMQTYAADCVREALEAAIDIALDTKELAWPKFRVEVADAIRRLIP